MREKMIEIASWRIDPLRPTRFEEDIHTATTSHIEYKERMESIAHHARRMVLRVLRDETPYQFFIISIHRIDPDYEHRGGGA